MEQLNIFLKEIEMDSYAEKYRQWQKYLEVASQADNYLIPLGYFLESFPFNYKYWIEYIELTKFQEYQTALMRNPKSFDLWISYLNNLKLLEKDALKYRKELQKAIIEIGADSRAGILYEQYYGMVTENVRFQFFKKIFTRALFGLQKFYQKFSTWFQQCTEQQISALAIKQYKNFATSQTFQLQKSNLKQLIDIIYNKTIGYRDRRLQLQQKIKHHYFDGSPQNNDQKTLWRQLNLLQRQNGIIENVSYCYERFLMAQTDDLELWEEFFHYMENQTNKYPKVLSILRNNKFFFIKFDLNIYLYWCDLEERENSRTARKMYEEIVTFYNTYEIYKRWIQFQIRQKQYKNAKSIFEKTLKIFKEDEELVSYILIDYSEFIIKYIKDFELAKNMLKSNMDSLNFNLYLFSKYLEFMKNFQNKEGYYEELMTVIIQCTTKAFKILNPKDFLNLIKFLKFYLRSTLGSIYLIKLSEQKILQVQEKLYKHSKIDHFSEKMPAQ